MCSTRLVETGKPGEGCSPYVDISPRSGHSIRQSLLLRREKPTVNRGELDRRKVEAKG